MELIAKELYHAGFGTLNVGDSTAAFELPEELKQQMLEDHPEWFEIVGSKASPLIKVKTDELQIETPEKMLNVETGEAKLVKSTRKK